MRKAEREIKDFGSIVELLGRCDTIRLGLNNGEYPYVVPVSFGFEVSDGRIVIYIHGAREGLKRQLIAANGKVCVEADLFNGYTGTGHGITADYASVIGFGSISPAEGDEAVHGISLILEHCGIEGYDPASCIALKITAVDRIVLDRVTGKKRF